MYDIKNTAKGLVAHGVSTCAGCGLELIIRHILDVLGENTVIVIPPGCAALFSGYGKETALRIPGFQGNLENTAAIAAGIRAGFEVQGRHDITVLAFAGDGATVDIGIQALSGMFERGERVLYVCYDNEAYMNTGIQGSGSTPFMAATTTTPGGKPSRRKNMLEIAAAHGIPYAASASAAYIDDLKKKVEKAKNTDGPSYLHIHTPCPTGWGFDPALSVSLARAAVQTGAWVLYEIEKGKLKLNSKTTKLKPVSDYLKPQGRFKHLSDKDIQDIQQEIDEYIQVLASRSENQAVI
ncbi:MAG: pyruvate ferredoxin oxidoreductase beta subunit [Acidobacteriota bacterium]|nr:pyruvate ferredoxin oxidoreductase beta subunit [Acidobacteriota bacterium]